MSAGKLGWRTAARIAWRDLRAARGKFLFIAFAIAVGVGSLVGVRGFGRSFRTMLLAEARTLMAADLMVRVFEAPTPAQKQLFDALELRGLARTNIIETISMITAGDDDPPVFCGIKAVEPEAYPLYGEVKLEPAALSLRAALTPEAVVVAEDLFTRLPKLGIGSKINLGEAEFRIAAIVRTEPDRMTGSMNVGTRVMVSRAGLERTGLVKGGSRAAQRHLFRFPSPMQREIGEVREEIKRAFPTALISDFRETHPLITSNLDRSERFLALVSLIALIIGALGVAATMHAHLQQRLDTIAIMKCLGARSSHVVRIYLAQTMLVGLIGGLAGVAIGSIVQAAFPLLIARYFSLAPAFRFDFLAAAEGITIGLLTATLFTWPALLGVEQIRPLMILRRDVTPARQGWVKPWLARLSTVALIAALAAWLAGTDRWRVGLYFAGGLAGSLLLLGGVSWILLWALRRLPRGGLPLAWRHGLANLYRPGNQAPAVLVSLGVGVMFTLAIYLIQHGMLDQIIANAPPNMPNVFLLNVTSREKDEVQALLKSYAGIQGQPELMPTLAARLATIDGEPIEKHVEADRRLRRYAQARAITMYDAPRPGALITAGAWWTKESTKPGQVCVLDDTARNLNLQPGARITWTAGIETITGTVVCRYKTEEVRMGGNAEFVFSPGSLDALPLQYFAALRVRQAAVIGFQKEAFRRLPSVTVINGADVVEIIQQVVDQIALVVRFISGFAILAGAIILASSVAATRFRRVKEVAILKTLGASRRTVATIFSVEFLILGAVAGLLGSLLATGFANLLLVRLLEGKARVDVWPVAVAIVLSAGIANVAGWLASARTLEQTPLAALRDE
ncbi:MAG: FtsX-like permease family protein [Acidobacteria bacterium]|nr:FtsX-like permease family protein [Acidobacteriota bacterium]